MNSEKVISNIKKAIKEHLDNNYAYDMLVDFELDVIDWNSLFEYIDKLQQVQQENQKLKENWNKLKEFIKKSLEAIDTIQKLIGNAIEDYNPRILTYKQIKDKMLELEKGEEQ